MGGARALTEGGRGRGREGGLGWQEKCKGTDRRKGGREGEKEGGGEGGREGGRDVPVGVSVSGIRESVREEGEEALKEGELSIEWNDGEGRHVEKEGGLEIGREGGRNGGGEGKNM